MDTGDVGYLDASGRLFVAGRDNEMIISGGENVFPRPVDEALALLPQVSEVAVIGVPDPVFGQRLAAFPVFQRFIEAHLPQLEDLHGFNELVARLLRGGACLGGARLVSAPMGDPLGEDGWTLPPSRRCSTPRPAR